MQSQPVSAPAARAAGGGDGTGSPCETLPYASALQDLEDTPAPSLKGLRVDAFLRLAQAGRLQPEQLGVGEQQLALVAAAGPQPAMVHRAKALAGRMRDADSLVFGNSLRAKDASLSNLLRRAASPLLDLEINAEKLSDAIEAAEAVHNAARSGGQPLAAQKALWDEIESLVAVCGTASAAHKTLADALRVRVASGGMPRLSTSAGAGGAMPSMVPPPPMDAPPVEMLDMMDKGDSYGHINKRRRVEEVPYDSNGNVLMPILLGPSLSVLSLGTVVPEHAAYHASNTIYPVGYRAIRMFQSLHAPVMPGTTATGGKRVAYTCCVLSNGAAPYFVLVPHDAPDHPITGPSPTSVWSYVVQTCAQRRGVTTHDPETGKAIVNVSGPEYFGLSNPTILRLLQRMPGSTDLVNYKHQDLVPNVPMGYQAATGKVAQEHVARSEELVAKMFGTEFRYQGLASGDAMDTTLAWWKGEHHTGPISAPEKKAASASKSANKAPPPPPPKLKSPSSSSRAPPPPPPPSGSAIDESNAERSNAKADPSDALALPLATASDLDAVEMQFLTERGLSSSSKHENVAGGEDAAVHRRAQKRARESTEGVFDDDVGGTCLLPPRFEQAPSLSFFRAWFRAACSPL